jgi:hypothetical protein
MKNRDYGSLFHKIRDKQVEMSEKSDSDAASFPGYVPWPSSQLNETIRQQDRSQAAEKARDLETGRSPRAGRGGAHQEEGDDNFALPSTRPKTRKDTTNDPSSANSSSIVGAHRVPGIYSPTRSDFPQAIIFTHSSVDLEAAALFDSRAVSLPPSVVAETVPELVSATAVPGRLGEGVTLPGHAKDEPDNRSRRCVYLGLVVALVIVAVVVGVSVAVTSSGRGGERKYCGSTFAAATQCSQACPNGVDSDCPNGETCFGEVTCSPSGGGGGDGGGNSENFCGTTWTAATQCSQACPNGEDSECPNGEMCFSEVTCSSIGGNYCGSTFTAATQCSQTCPNGVDGDCPNGETCFGEVTCSIKSSSSNTEDEFGTASPGTPFPTSTPSTSSPTLPPTPLATEKLFTTFENTHSYYGHMFDITAKTDIDIIAMEVHLESTDPEKIEVWTKDGEYHGFETDQFRWAKIGEATVTGKGPNVLTPLPRDLFDPIRVGAGDKQAFYVTAQTESIFFQERMNAAGNVSTIDYGEATEFKNSALEINVGTGVQYLFQNHGPPNIFNGALEYALV